MDNGISDGLSDYERLALQTIEAWENPERGLLSRVLDVARWPVDKAGELAMEVPGLGTVLEAVNKTVVSVANDAAQGSVRKNSIFKDFRGKGHAVERLGDIAALDLQAVDAAIGYLAAKYKAAALAEGAGAGALGLPGMAIDVPAVMVLALRAVGEYATYCGFDVDTQQERVFAMQVLGHASSNNLAKAAMQAQLNKLALELARKAAWKKLEEQALVRLLRELAQQVGVRLTKAKLAQALPAAGAVVGGAVNTWFIAQVCDSAYHLYRKRFLLAKQAAAGTLPEAPADD
ncbi:MAG: EcsC family protein [Myxococcales bacterium]|nr:EcsC family protein [Myxococcales bacterium]MCB9523094.1 EcsC family protein [Myxococcales bacterium]